MIPNTHRTTGAPAVPAILALAVLVALPACKRNDVPTQAGAPAAWISRMMSKVR